MRLPPVDINGRRLKRGDRVRVMGVPPDAAAWRKSTRDFSLPVFKYLVGTYKTIEAWNEFGEAELTFKIPSGKHKGWHVVWLEPFLLRRVQPRSRVEK